MTGLDSVQDAIVDISQHVSIWCSGDLACRVIAIRRESLLWGNLFCYLDRLPKTGYYGMARESAVLCDMCTNNGIVY